MNERGRMMMLSLNFTNSGGRAHVPFKRKRWRFCTASATWSLSRTVRASQGLVYASLRLARVLGDLESNHNPCREEALWTLPTP